MNHRHLSLKKSFSGYRAVVWGLSDMAKLIGAFCNSFV